jgi:enterochelin esterase-like enzyme
VLSGVGRYRPAGPAVKCRRAAAALAVLLALAMLAGACGAPSASPPPAAPGTLPPPAPASMGATSSPSAGIAVADLGTLADLRDALGAIAAADPGAAQTQVDGLWTSLVDEERVPLVLGSTDVVFLYRGAADTIEWRGSFNNWSDPGLAGTRVGSTDLWIAQATLPARSRIEYKIVRDGTDWLVDPGNPRTAYSGLTGVNNTVALPGFTVTDESAVRSGTPAGRLDAGLSITSRELGYEVAYWVYTPAGSGTASPLPVLYVLDGNDFVDERMGALPAVLDNLISAGRIAPVMAVFIDAREPGNPDRNRRADEFLARPVEHAGFIVDELVPAIDRAYATRHDPAGRVIAGVSYGGVSATDIAFAHPDVFGNLAAFSPSLWAIDSPEYLADAAQAAGARLIGERLAKVTTCGSDGPVCPPMRIFLSAGIPDWDVGDLSSLARILDRQGYDIDYEATREGHTWDQWRGLSDEMLAYLVGPPADAR